MLDISTSGRLCQNVVMTNPSQGDEVEVEFQLVWPDGTGSHSVAANQFVFAWDQNLRNMLYMHLGHAATPLWVNPEIARQRAAAAGGKPIELAIEPVGSFVMDRDRAEELYRALGRHLGITP